MRSYRSLLRVVAAVDVAALAAVAIAVRDKEAAAFALAALAGTALLRFRGGTLGTVVLALLFADQAFWMVTGAVSNLAHGEPIFVPGPLAVLAWAGLKAALGSLIWRRDPTAGRYGAPVLAAGASMLIVAALVGSAFARPARARPGDVLVRAQNVAFSPKRLSVRTGDVRMTVTNRDLFWHTFSVPELGVDVRLPTGARRRTVFAARAGTYEFVCRIPGHPAAGMRGTLVVLDS